MRKFIGALGEALLVSFVLVSPALASEGPWWPSWGWGDRGGPFPTLGAGLPFLVVVGGAYLVVRFLTRGRKQGV